YGSTNNSAENQSLNTKNISLNNQSSISDIFNKLKNRLPMFIINIYCTTTTVAYGDDMLTGSLQTSDETMFQKYYIFLCICVIIWDLWHASESHSSINKNNENSVKVRSEEHTSELQSHLNLV